MRILQVNFDYIASCEVDLIRHFFGSYLTRFYKKKFDTEPADSLQKN